MGRTILKVLGLFFGMVIAIVLIGVLLPTALYGPGDPTVVENDSTTPPSPAPETPTPAPRPTQTPSPKPTDSADRYFRSYEWSYGGDAWVFTIAIPKDAYRYYRDRPHNRERDYAQYALSDYDRRYLKSIVDQFREAGDKGGYSDYENIMNVVSFVQSLSYTSDSVTTGYDEYPRYPLETLVDNGGDCEDSAILTAALLREMGYDAVLIKLSQHMAVGVNCPDTVRGAYYEYRGSRYYYLETTGGGWDIGQLPPEYEQNSSATIHPLVQTPRMGLSFTCRMVDCDDSYSYYRVRCDLKNVGSGTASNPVIAVSALAPAGGEDGVWDQKTVELDDCREGATGRAEVTVAVPRGKATQVRCILSGSNFKPVELTSKTFPT